MNRKKVLLTGATGFLGKNVVPVLSEEYEVIGVGSEWDLREPQAVDNLFMLIM